MGWAEDIAAWAWARHHNEWSWWIRPFFLLPWCWFAWRRSLAGLAVTLVALLTSMAWFPAPDVPSRMASAVLAAERDYLLGPWGPAKVAVALLVPGTLAALALAFWRRSIGWGVAVVNAMVLMKVGWTFVIFSSEGALHHLVPAAFGLAACNAVLAAAWWACRRRAAVQRRS